MKRIYVSIILFSFIFMTLQLFATNNIWVGTTASWNTAGNWSLGHVPNAANGDIATFSTNNKSCTFDVALTGAAVPAGISISSTYASTIKGTSGLAVTIGASGISMTGTSAAATLDLSGIGAAFNCTSLTMAKGTFKSVNGNTSTFSGAVNISGGTFIAASSGALASTMLTFNSSFSQSGGTFTGNTRYITANGTFALTGSASFTSTSTILFIENNFNNSATFNNHGGTVEFDAITDASASSANTLFAFLDIEGGTLTAPANMSVAQDFIFNTGTFNHNNGTITFNGTTTFPGSSVPTFYNVTISGTINAGPIFNVAGNFVNNGTFDATSGGTITFTGNTTISGASTTSFNTIDIESTLTAPAGVNLNIAGDFIDNGTFNHNNGTITFNDNGFANNTTFPGSQIPVFYNLTISSSALSVTFPSALTINGAFTDNNSPSILDATTHSNTLTFSGTTSITTLSATPLYNITISSGTLTGDAGTINLAGNFTNNAAYTHNSGTVNFNGTAAQTIGGTSTTTFNNMTLANGAGASLTQSANLVGVLSINSGTFTTTGQTFTLLSTAGATASIAPILGNFAGNITMQRYAPAGMGAYTADWRFLSSAVSGAHISDWANYFTVSGIPGGTCPPGSCAGGCANFCSWASVDTYDETKAAGNKDNPAAYISPVSTGDLLDGKGFWVYMGPTPLTFQVSGPPNKSDYPLTTTYTSSGSLANDGWNLVPNPYPSAIDWDAPTDGTHWDKTNIGGTIYIWNSSTESYGSYVAGSGGIGLNGGSNLIPSQQAFWVHATGAPTLTVRELVKSNTLITTYLRTMNSPNTSHIPMAFKDFPIPLNTNNTPNSIKLTASGNGQPDDEILIRFMQGATNNFDNQYDGLKLPGYHSNLSSVLNSTDYCINSLPPLTSNMDIPIRLNVPAAGTYKISRDSILMLPMSSCIFLEDTKAVGTNLRTSVSYSFTISDTTGQAHAAPRFILHIYEPMTKKSMNVSCAGGNNGIAIAKGIGAGPWNYVWKNSAGTTVKTTSGSSTADTLKNCSAGTYSVSVDGASCGTVTDTIKVNAPAILTSSVSPTNVSCFGGNNGIATVMPSGGSPSYSYLWNNNQTTSTVTNLVFGNYSVTITDANGCTTNTTVSITQPTVLSTSVSPTNVSCFGSNNGIATVVVSGGSPTYSYLWNNNQTTSTATNLVLGNYSVTITDAHGCTSTATIAITQPTALTNTVSQTNVSCFGGNNGTAAVVANGGSPAYSYLWNNGQTTSAEAGLNAINYSVVVTDANGCTSTSTVAISQPVALVVGFSASTYTLDISVGNNVTFTNSSSGANSYQWNFGDVSGIDISANPTHSYTSTGTYTVTLIASDGTCSDSIHQIITVVNSNPTSVNTIQSSSSVNVVYDNGEVFLLFALDKTTPVNISVFNMIGEKIYSQNNLFIKNDKIKLNLNNPSAGIYIAVSEIGMSSDSYLISKKIFIPAAR